MTNDDIQQKIKENLAMADGKWRDLHVVFRGIPLQHDAQALDTLTSMIHRDEVLTRVEYVNVGQRSWMVKLYKLNITPCWV